MNTTNFKRIKGMFLEKKKITIPATILVLVVLFFMFRSNSSNLTTVDSVVRTDLAISVRATGQVISNTDLDLSFNKPSTVKRVSVKVGDTVLAGQVLAALDQGEVLARLTQAKAALLLAQAKYDKTLQGSSGEEVSVADIAFKNAQTDLENTKNNQALLVSNAYQNLLNSPLVALSSATSGTQTAPTISGTYTGGKEGDIKITVNQTGNGGYLSFSGLVNAPGVFSTASPQPIGNSGLYIQFPVSYTYQYDWTISIPNKQASNYLANYNAYQNALRTQSSAISSAQSLVDQKQAELNLKKASARQPDIDIANADILSAKGSLQSTQAAYEDTVIRTPASGTVTKVDIKYGEIAQVGKVVITVEDVKNLYIEARINEANISYLKLGQSVAVTFDAFGNDKKFTGAIVQIDPSAESSDGVVNYKIKISINEKDETIRPGMNANITILAGEKKNVLAIPNVAVTKKEAKSFVNVITNEKKKEYKEREVTTGFVGDNNLVEISAGLLETDKIAITKK